MEVVIPREKEASFWQSVMWESCFVSHESVERPVSHGAAKMAKLPHLENGGSFWGPGA